MKPRQSRKADGVFSIPMMDVATDLSTPAGESRFQRGINK
jgi:hypothetical protein